MKFKFGISLLSLAAFFLNISAMNYVPTLTRLSTDAAGKNVSPMRFTTNEFTQKYWPFYNDIGLRMLEQEGSEEDKVDVASHVISKTVTENQCQTSSLKNNLNPFLDILAEGVVKPTCAPSTCLIFGKFPRLEDSITKALAPLALSTQQKGTLRKPTELALWRTFTSLYTHSFVLERTKRSFLDRLDKSDISHGLKKIFTQEISNIESFEDTICLVEIEDSVKIAGKLLLLRSAIASSLLLTTLSAASTDINNISYSQILNLVLIASALANKGWQFCKAPYFVASFPVIIAAQAPFYASKRRKLKKIFKQCGVACLGFLAADAILNQAVRALALSFLTDEHKTTLSEWI